MAKTKEQWAEAKAIYEGTIGEKIDYDKIYIKTSIDRSTITKKAKKDIWVKGKNAHKVIKEIQLDKEKSELTSELNPSEEKVHHDNVLEVNKNLELTESVAVMGQKLIGLKFNKERDNLSMPEIKYGLEANHKAGQTLGVVAQFATTSITNTNAQQSNEQLVINKVYADNPN